MQPKFNSIQIAWKYLGPRVKPTEYLSNQPLLTLYNR